MTFEAFVNKVYSVRASHPAWRAGQTLFNCLYEVRPDLAKQIDGTDLDPFYLDERVQAAWEFIAERW